MKARTRSLRYIFVALLLCALAAVSFAFTLSARAEEGEQTPVDPLPPPDYVLVLDESDRTKVTGIEINATGDIYVELPSAITQIGDYAFVGKSQIKSIKFNDGLRAVGNFALAGTGVSSLTFPKSVERIGIAAVADCASLTAVTLPAELKSLGVRAFGNLPATAYFVLPEGFNVSVEVDEDALDDNATVIAADIEQYKAITAIDGGLKAWFTGEGNKGAYPVTIEYMYAGVLLDTETRLWGKPYTYCQNAEGVWGSNDEEKLGTAITGEKVWYANNDASTNASETAVTELLKTQDVKTIVLYSFPTAGSNVYVGRNDIVYDGKEYGMTELNPLLAGASTPILSTDNVLITHFEGFDGTTEIPNKDGALVVRDAGVYTLEVYANGSDPEPKGIFTLRVARRSVDLGAYSNLNFKLTKVGDTAIDGGAELINADGYTLYLYSKADGTVVPCENVLTADEAAALEVGFGNYTTELVRYSVVRNRGARVEIGASNAAYTVAYENGGNVGKDVGKYTTVANLTADKNYELVCRTVSDGKGRNLNVEVAADGRSAVVTKVWYIVDVGNYFVGNNDLDYDIGTRVYGDGTAFALPRLAYGDVSAADYGKESDPVTLTLYFGENDIPVGGENNSFTRREFGYYLAGGAMPAGDYRLVLRAEATSHEETGAGGVVLRTVYHNAFTHTVRFTVDKREVLESELQKIDDLLKGKTFRFVWTGESHLLYSETETAVNAVLAANSVVNRADTVWAGGEYDGYYGGLELSFNLMRLQSDAYYTASALEVSTSNPDKYVVYYSVGGKNFYSSIETLPFGGTRTDYFFNVVNVMSVAIPVFKDKYYTGGALVADIVGNDIYTVTTNAGGVDVGGYEVSITFYKPDYYMWDGQTLDTMTASVRLTFRIRRAANEWRVKPDIASWEVGSYNAEDNAVSGAAVFGSTRIVITDSRDNVIYDSEKGINKLASVRAGTYNMTATVADTANYNGLSYSAFVRVFAKPGLPWWGILLIVVGALLLAAIVIFVLWKKKVFEILTGKLALAIRTRATVDATIAAVRASKIAEESKKAVAAAKRKDAAAARKAAAEAEKNKPAEERAAALEAKAQAAEQRVEKMRAKAEAMRSMAERARAEASTPEASDTPEATEPATEAAATDNTETPTEE